MTRTDLHRPSAFVPANYEYLCSYSLPTSYEGEPVPGIGLQYVVELTSAAHNSDTSIFGCTGYCGVCGHSYTYGDVWKHTPTGALVHLGHECADKYSLLTDRSAWELENGRIRDALAVEITKKKNALKRAIFLDGNPGLETALEVDHYLIADIKKKFVEYCALTEKQVALVLKIAAEAKAPHEEEKHVAAPVGGRITFRGVVLGTKTYENDFGTSIKATIKVSTPEGSWLAWGTAPSGLFDGGPIKGCEVEITATLDAGREPHFALMRRPRGKVINRPEEQPTK